ncbi:MAG: 4Fe-4S single cluster domain-containing protein [Planctomycetota bacterium]
MGTSENRDEPEGVLRLARWKLRCEVLGPGVRAVLWFHGCSLDCPGCIAREMNASAEVETWTPTALAERLIAVEGIEGVTLTGGDPFDQDSTALAGVLARLQEAGLSVLCYTGRTLEQLLERPSADAHRSLLRYVDMLIDGPYVAELNDGALWRGSSNQYIHFLSARYRHLADAVRDGRSRALEVDWALDGTLSIAGIPKPGFLRRLVAQLDRRGVHLVLKQG